MHYLYPAITSWVISWQQQYAPSYAVCVQERLVALSQVRCMCSHHVEWLTQSHTVATCCVTV
jgi:hypothetical protein